MTIILDASPLIAQADRRDPRHSIVREIVENYSGALVVPAPITAEVDYLLNARTSSEAARAFLDDLANERFRVECLDPHEYAAAVELDRRYADLRLGLADLSIVVLARRFGTRRLLTFDQRHFRAVEPLQGGEFSLLPFDADA